MGGRSPPPLLPLAPLLSLLLVLPVVVGAAGLADGSEEWGYVQVRPKAHMFWWLYRSPHRVDNASTPWPTVLWLQGGPGASGVGIGNFQEIGPLDTDLKPRTSTWMQKADLLFVDNPVGTGYSFVEDAHALAKTDEEAGADLTTLLKELFKQLQGSPLYIVAESYGGKFAVTLGLSAARAIQAGELKLKLGASSIVSMAIAGVALGDSWISPQDFVDSWGPLLRDVSRLDSNGLDRSNSIAAKIQKQIEGGQYRDATQSWEQLETVISSASNSVDFYNFLLDSAMDPLSTAASAAELPRGLAVRRYTRYLSSKASASASAASFPGAGAGGGLSGLMNGPIKQKLKIIPNNVSWGAQADLVFDALSDDFMKPRINEVDELLASGVSVTIYNGQLDLICATKGVEAWVQKLRWEGLKNFTSSQRKTIYCGDDGATKAFTKSYRNLRFYWILGAGHFVPVDQPCVSLKMLSEITQSPAAASAAAVAVSHVR